MALLRTVTSLLRRLEARSPNGLTVPLVGSIFTAKSSTTMAKQKSRTKRWFEAIDEVRQAYEAVAERQDDLASAFRSLHDVQMEYQDWLDNLPENLQSSALGEKLQAVTEIDIESMAEDPMSNWEEVVSTLDEAEGVELPQGFGRD